MANLFYAWEFGAGLGHIGAFLPLGRALRDSGHEVRWAVTQTAPAARLLAKEGFTWMQAPVARESQHAGSPLTYADILLRFGYRDVDDLSGLVVAWRELMQLAKTQLVLADHAPTAVLAARTLGIPVMLFSSGFTVPPRQRPLPNMRPWAALSQTQLLAIEDAALASVNAVLGRFGQAPLDALWEMFDVAEEALITFPELDHYPNRGPGRYWGSLPNAAIGQAPRWPDGPGKKIFAYLRPETPHLEAIFTALRDIGLPALVYAPGLKEGNRQRWHAPHLAFVQEPVDLTLAAQGADLAISYAGLATATGFLLAGKPLLLSPFHLEQYLLGQRVAGMGAGVCLNPEQAPGDLGPVFAALLDQPSFTANARAFAEKYAAFDQQRVVGNLVKRIDELCPQSATR